MSKNTDVRLTALYRFYDSSGQLLYIGIAFDPEGRQKQHASSKRWWSEVDQERTTIKWHPDRETADAAELLAIRIERPRYNIVTSDDNGCARFLPRIDGTAWGRPTWVPSDEQATILNDLAAVTAERLRIEGEIAALIVSTSQAARESERAGIPISWLAEASGLTRKTVYRHLGKPMK